ncbi:MAG: M23 family metallopeptidase [Fimbriimonadales bacterium]|nr:M23 family metallopeptidase [Fimbriimonadales bacterium]
MRWIHPLQPQARARVDAFFLDPLYPRYHPDGSQHPGVDINLMQTSGNQDLGYPVVAQGEGIVVHARFHRVWGNLVEVSHPWMARKLAVPYFSSVYAHLQHISVEVNQLVQAGTAIGSIGQGDPAKPWFAHLHWENRIARFPADYWPHKDTAFIRSNYRDPLVILKEYGDNAYRWSRPTVRLYLPNGTFTYYECVLNLNDPNIGHVRLGLQAQDM